MDSEQLRSLKEELNRPLWKYIEKTILADIVQMRKDASLTHVQDLDTQSQRDELLYGANALEQFIEKLPRDLDDKYKQALEKEEKHD